MKSFRVEYIRFPFDGLSVESAPAKYPFKLSMPEPGDESLHINPEYAPILVDVEKELYQRVQITLRADRKTRVLIPVGDVFEHLIGGVFVKFVPGSKTKKNFLRDLKKSGVLK